MSFVYLFVSKNNLVKKAFCVAIFATSMQFDDVMKIPITQIISGSEVSGANNSITIECNQSVALYDNIQNKQQLPCY